MGGNVSILRHCAFHHFHLSEKVLWEGSSMRKLEMRQVFFLVALVEIALLGTFALLGLRMRSEQARLGEAQYSRYRMTQVADRLRQSSDDLTRFARQYVVTGAPEFLEAFRKVLAIRDGEAPRPKAYHRIYWDLDPATRSRRHLDGQIRSLAELLDELPFSAAERQALERSHQESDALVGMEQEAFNAMVGLFRDDEDEYTIEGAPRQAYAIQLLHSSAYLQAKHRIMLPIDQFLHLLDTRTHHNVAQHESALEVLSNWQRLILGLFIIVHLMVILTVNRYLIVPIREIIDIIRGSVGRKLSFPEQKLSELHIMTQEYEQYDQQLLQAKKMEAIGQLSAGIAHEINTPTQYVSDNTRFLQGAFEGFLPLLHKMEKLIEVGRDGPIPPDLLRELEDEMVRADLDELTAEIPYAIEQTAEGIGRVSEIVLAMRNLSHPGKNRKEALDLNRAIESTVTVARNEWKYVSNLSTEFDSALPPVPCLVGDFNQMILNLIVNAAHAIADKSGGTDAAMGRITIKTRLDGEFAELSISDTGVGIPEEILDKIFDPFFTTKEVGRGTGQGLSIVHTVVTRKHGGTIHVDSEVGVGTVFTIRLPLTDPSDERNSMESLDEDPASPVSVGG
jgi:signal transduction histidine kinase